MKSAIIYWYDPKTNEKGRISTQINDQCHAESVIKYYTQSGGWINIGHGEDDRMVKVYDVKLQGF